jgi:hypothetical protein
MILGMSLGHDAREVFLDARGNGRALRLSWHHDVDVVVLSLWREGVCAGTFRLPKSQVNDFIDALVDGLRGDEPVHQPSHRSHRSPGAASDSAGNQSMPETQPSFMSWAFEDIPDQRANAG